MNAEDYLQKQIEEEGTFRAFPVVWTIEQSTKSQAAAIALRFAIHQKWDPDLKIWSDVYPPGWFTENRTWIVKSDGTLNEKAVSNLRECGLWDGDFEKITGKPPSVFVHVDIGAETYEGTTRYRANWINPNEDVPRPRGEWAPADTSLVESLRGRFQSQTRAIAGGQPKGTPPAPPAMQPAPTGAPAVPGNTPAAPTHPQPAPALPANPTGAPTTGNPGTATPGAPSTGNPSTGSIAPPIMPPTGGEDDPVDPDKPPF